MTTQAVDRSLEQVARQTAHRAAPKWLAERRATEGRTALEAGRAYDALQRAYLYSGQGPELIFSNLCCLNMLERVERTPELAVAYGLVAQSFSTAPLGAASSQAGQYTDQALRACKAENLAPAALAKCENVAEQSLTRVTKASQAFCNRGNAVPLAAVNKRSDKISGLTKRLSPPKEVT